MMHQTKLNKFQSAGGFVGEQEWNWTIWVSSFWTDLSAPSYGGLVVICCYLKSKSIVAILNHFELFFTYLERGAAYILKADVLDVRTPQKIQIFCRKIVWERENYQSQSLKANNSAMCYK